MKKFDGMLLACDMDGTLLNNTKQISTENRLALQYFAEQGGRLSIATGRSPYAIDTYMKQLPINAPYSVMNGSLICNARGQILYSFGMPIQAKEMINQVLLNNSQFGCEIFTSYAAFVRQMSDYTLQHMHKLNLDYQMLSDEQFAKSSVDQWCTINFTGKPEQIIVLAQELAEKYPNVFDITSSISTFCEITAAGVNKGSALHHIAEHESHINRIAAIGDSFNDLSMLREADIAFAPQNAETVVLQAADVIVSSNNEHAVADVVEYLDRL